MLRNALIVGIRNYDQTVGLRNLESAPRDAQSVVKILRAYGNFDSVTPLPTAKDRENLENSFFRVSDTDKAKVTQDTLEVALEKLFLPDDNIPELALFFFSGHGLRKGRKIQKGFLATSEANPKENFWGVELEFLRRCIHESPIRQLVVWLDCCHSGEMLRDIGGKQLLEDINREIDVGNRGEGKSLFVLTASRSDEDSYVSAGGQYGLFTTALLEGLDPSRSLDGIINNDSLVQFIQEKFKGQIQTPLWINPTSEIILTAAPQIVTLPNLEGECPYKGLQYFDIEDAKYFKGRDSLTDDLIDRVKVGNGNFVAVLGASGSGKSSVVRAGLLHNLREGTSISGSSAWKLCIFTPTAKPLASLALALVDAKTDLERAAQLKLSEEALAEGSSGLARLIQASQTPRTVVFIDQFEEIFTLCRGNTKEEEEQKSQERQQFIDCILGALQQTGNRFCVVLAMRSDFYAKCLDYRLLADLIGRQIPVGAMKPEELKQAILYPAKQIGLGFDPSLADRLVDELVSVQNQQEGQSGNLPLLEFTLEQLWQHRETRLNRITLRSYQQVGNVRKVLEKHADSVYTTLSDEEKIIAKRIFLELTQLGEGTEDTRRRVLKSNLLTRIGKSAHLTEEVLRKLADKDARLVVIESEPAVADKPATVTVIHEALIRYWKQLRQWLDESRSALTEQRKIQKDVEEWKNHSRSSSYLLRGDRLNSIEAYLEYLSDDEQEFFETSKKTWIAEETEREKQTLETLLLFSETAWQQHKQLESLIAILRAGRRLQETKFLPDNESQVRAKLHQTIYHRIQEKNRLQGHSSRVNSVAFSPDGQTLASASSDKTIKLWSRHGEELLTLSGHSSRVYSVAFSPDGQTLASAGDDKTIKLWNRQGEELLTLSGHSSPVNGVAFSPDGQTLASAGDDKTIKLWNRQGEELLTLLGHSDHVYGVVFSPDGETIASASWDSTVKLWNRHGENLLTLSGHSNRVNRVAFSPDGETIASASWDNTVKLWNKQGEELLVLSGHNNAVNSVGFSFDGQTIASASDDNTVKLWNREGKELLTLFGHNSRVNSVTFSPDGQIIASASGDITVRLWEHKQKKSPSRLSGHDDMVTSVAFSPDGQTIASASADRTIKLWSRQGDEFLTFQGHSSTINGVAFSPDGQIIASASWDSTVKLWNRQGRNLLTLSGHSGRLYSVTFSPDGQIIASASGDKVIKLWSREGEELLSLLGHSDTVYSVAFSPDGQIIASASDDKSVKLWNRQGESLLNFLGHSGGVYSVAFSPDGQTIASASADRTIKLWNRQGEELLTLSGHSSRVNSVAFSPDGQIIASASWDNTVKLWNRQGEELLSLLSHDDDVHNVVFSPDGRTIASASGDSQANASTITSISRDNTVKLFNLDDIGLNSLLAKGCSWLCNYLTNNSNVGASDEKLCDSIGEKS